MQISPEDVEVLVGLAVLLIYSCRYPTKLTWPRAQSLLTQARQIVSFDQSEVLESLEENCFCWKMFLEPKNAHVRAKGTRFDELQSCPSLIALNIDISVQAMGSYAVFLQVVRYEFDKVRDRLSWLLSNLDAIPGFS